MQHTTRNERLYSYPPRPRFEAWLERHKDVATPAFFLMIAVGLIWMGA